MDIDREGSDWVALEGGLIVPRQGMSRRQLFAMGASAAAVALLAACGGSDGNGSSTSTAPSGTGSVDPETPRPGGRLTVGLVGGGSSETLHPLQAAFADIDIARQVSLYDSLAVIGFDGNPQLELAESMEPNADGTEWTIRLREGVLFHDGSPLTLEDVIYTLNYAADPAAGAVSISSVAYMDLAAIKKLDDRTFLLPMKQPVGDLYSLIGSATLPIIKDGATQFDTPNGTGPFKFKSWTPGQESLFEKFPDYWESGKPYVDELVLVSLPDEAARLNALLGGQVDAASSIGYAQAKSYQEQGDSAPFVPLIADSPGIVPLTMGSSQAPFTDVRVRQAFRLMVDRQQMIDQVQSGLGNVANDIYGAGYPFYNDALPQRERDIDQAKFLLKEAGQEGLTITLSSSRAIAGMLESATLFAQQAKEAGVTVNVENLPAGNYFSTGWPNYQFGQSQWRAAPLSNFYLTSSYPGAPYNETQWENDVTAKLIGEAFGEVDKTKLPERWAAVQEVFYEEGAYIIWGTSPFVDGVAKNVGGAKPSSSYALSSMTFKDYWKR